MKALDVNTEKWEEVAADCSKGRSILLKHLKSREENLYHNQKESQAEGTHPSRHSNELHLQQLWHLSATAITVASKETPWCNTNSHHRLTEAYY